MELNPSTTAFLACHWENDIVGAEGAFAPFFRSEVEKHGVIDVAKSLLEGARSAGAQVVYTRVAFADGHSDLVTNVPLLGVVAQQQCLLDGTGATEIIDELKPSAEDWVVTNPKVGAFASSDLDERLRAAGIDTVVIFGVATNLSVESTGR
jgi:biuret amidohydrolase